MTVTESMASMKIVSRGRYGDLIYREQDNELVCAWEFLAGDCLAVVFLPDVLPAWVSQNLANVMHNIAEYVIRTQAPLHTAVIDERDRSITIRRPSEGPR